MNASDTPKNFLGLEKEFADPATAGFVVLPIRYDATATFLKGSSRAPDAIIAASQQVELFDEILLDDFHRCGIYTAPALTGNNLSAEQMQQRIYKTAKPFIQAGKILLSLGGEHSITPALIKAAAEKYSDLSVLQIDAHADLRDEYQGTKFSHACVMRRIFDMHVPAAQVGIRSFDKAQYDFIVKNKLKIFTPQTIAANPDWTSEVLASLSDNVYITLDFDALDPAYAPGVGTPEPGGLTYQQVLDLIFAVGKKTNIVAADIVEVIPNVAGVVTEFTAAKLAYKIITAAQLKERS